MTGRLVLQQDSYQSAAGTYDVELPLKNLSLSRGIYLIRLEYEGEQKVMRLVVE